MEITINSFDGLQKFCKDERINFMQAKKAIEAYSRLIVIDTKESTKAELLQELELYIKAYASLPPDWERPLFMILKGTDETPRQN
jgi:hypothetical protein